MAQQTKTFQHLRASASAALAGLGIVILFVRLEGLGASLSNLYGSVACEALRLVPYLFPAAWRALQTFAFGLRPATPCPVQMLVSLWPLLCAAVGAV